MSISPSDVRRMPWFDAIPPELSKFIVGGDICASRKSSRLLRPLHAINDPVEQVNVTIITIAYLPTHDAVRAFSVYHAKLSSMFGGDVVVNLALTNIAGEELIAM